MEDLTSDDILELHKTVETRFNVFQGVKDPGLVQAIADRPNQNLFGKFIPYDNIYAKAASIMEGIIRLHPFFDGNKRTALLAVTTYMEINGYYMVLPLSAVRFTVMIAKTKTRDDKGNGKLIAKIAKWIEKLSDTDVDRITKKHDQYVIQPVKTLLTLNKFKLKWLASGAVSRWMAFDIYPEYEKEADDIASFLNEVMRKSFSHDLLSRKKTNNNTDNNL